MSSELWHYILNIQKFKKIYLFWFTINVLFSEDTHCLIGIVAPLVAHLDLLWLDWTLYPSKSVKLLSPEILIEETAEE